MNGGSDKAEEPGTTTTQVAEAESSQAREVSTKKLKAILAAHEKWWESDGKKGTVADLQGAVLRGADLQEANLQGANLQGAVLSAADLQGADLTGANLEEANLQGAILHKAHIWEANLQGAFLQEAHLEGAHLPKANLQGAFLIRANFEGADLEEANLQGTDLQEANLQGAYLRGANLVTANLWKANLQRADLPGADLEEAKLSNANLQRAKLSNANLQRANLEEANLQGTDLQEANLQGAYLIRANFEGDEYSNLAAVPLDGADLRNADLRDARLSDVTGLLPGALAGANLSNTRLPEDIATFEGLANVEETSRNARKIFLAMLLGCVYSWLTIATTTDARLLTNSTSSPLPIIQTEIPIAGFYWATPLLLFVIYFYFHLYLQRLWEGLAGLPAVFPDGKPLHQKAYPWLLNGLVRAHFRILRDTQTLLSRLENWVSIVLAWWAVPFTLLLFWGRYLPRHDWAGTSAHIALLTISIGAAILLHRHAARTLRGAPTAFRWKTPWRDARTYQGAIAVVLGLFFGGLSDGVIDGDQTEEPRFTEHREWVPAAFALIGYSTFADFREADVSTKPDNWRGKTEDIPLVKGASLREQNLRYANAVRAFLVKADLRRANLEGASLSLANLQGADLRFANLQRADLSIANLEGANLRFAELQGANLGAANFQEADLGGANLEGANLRFTELQGANLGAANLRGTDVQSADLSRAKFIDVNLDGANLDAANLSGASDLNCSQLTSAKAWELAYRDPELACNASIPSQPAQ